MVKLGRDQHAIAVIDFLDRRAIRRGDFQRQGGGGGSVIAIVQCAAIVLHLETETGVGNAGAIDRRGKGKLARRNVGGQNGLPGNDGAARQGQAAQTRQAGDDDRFLCISRGAVGVGEREIGGFEDIDRVPHKRQAVVGSDWRQVRIGVGNVDGQNGRGGSIQPAIGRAAIVAHAEAEAGIIGPELVGSGGEDEFARRNIRGQHGLPGQHIAAIDGERASGWQGIDDDGEQAVGGNVACIC